MKTISTTNVPQPSGHYSQAMVCGGVVYVAGQLGSDPARPGAPAGSAADQTRQALANVSAILEEAGSSLDHALQVTIYVSGIELWAEVNEAYAEVMGDHRPARAIVPVGAFKGAYTVEIVTTAMLP